MAFKALILRVVADEERSRPKSTPPAHPWGTVRSNDAPKAAAAPKKSKTGSSNQ